MAHNRASGGQATVSKIRAFRTAPWAAYEHYWTVPDMTDSLRFPSVQNVVCRGIGSVERSDISFGMRERWA